MNQIFKYFPLIGIAVTLINAFTGKARVQKYIDQNPHLRQGYNRLLWGMAAYGSIPFVIMATGNLTGVTNTVFDYFDVRAMNPAVTTFYGSIITANLAVAYWVFFNGGTSFFATHPGILVFNSFGTIKEITSPTYIKMFFALIFLSGLLAPVVLWLWNIHPPVFN